MPVGPISVKRGMAGKRLATWDGSAEPSVTPDGSGEPSYERRCHLQESHRDAHPRTVSAPRFGGGWEQVKKKILGGCTFQYTVGKAPKVRSAHPQRRSAGPTSESPSPFLTAATLCRYRKWRAQLLLALTTV